MNTTALKSLLGELKKINPKERVVSEENIIEYLISAFYGNSAQVDKTSEKEINIQVDTTEIVEACYDISKYVEAFCRCLSLAFCFPASDNLFAHVLYACKEAIFLCPDKEQVLDGVIEWPDHGVVEKVNIYLIQSLLLLEIHDLQSAIQRLKKGQNLISGLNQHNQLSWSRRIESELQADVGQQLFAQGKIKNAEEAFKRAVKLWPKTSLYWSNLGLAYVEQNRLREALNVFKRALELDNRHSLALGGRAMVYTKQRKWEKSEIELQKALDYRAEGSTYNDLGNSQLRQGKVLSAISSYRRGLSLDPKQAFLWCNLGCALLELGRYKEANTAIRQAISLRPDNWQLLQSLIDYLIKAKQPQDAAKELERGLIFQLERAKTAPLLVARDFIDSAHERLLSQYGPVSLADGTEKLPGSGGHIIDRYLMVVHQALIEGLKDRELEPFDVITSLLYVGTLWCLYAEKLQQKGLDKDFARERLYAIKQDFSDFLPGEAKQSGYTAGWAERQVRMETTSPDEFAQKMLQLEPIWLDSVAKGQKQGEVEDLRWQFQGNLWVHQFEYQREKKMEHLQRIHYYMELLKGHTVLHKLIDPRIMGKAMDPQKWNRYASSLPVKVDRTATVDLETCTTSLPENTVSLSFYFLHRELLPNLLIVIIFRHGQAPCIRIVKAEERLAEFKDSAERLKQMHHLVACREKVPATGRVFCELSGEKKELSGSKLVDAVVEWENHQLRRAYNAILEGIIDLEELRDKHLYISPSPEMYDIPFSLLLKGDKFLNNIAESITIVPIFSLRQFQSDDILPTRSGSVLCLEQDEKQDWESQANHRAKHLAYGWCNGPIACGIDHGLYDFTDEPKLKYDAWIDTVRHKWIGHVIGHNDASQWSLHTDLTPNLGQFGRYLYDVPEKLSTSVMALETCWGGTWAEPEELMGLFVSFLASGVSYVIASPYSVVPTATSGKLFSYIYRHHLKMENSGIGLEMARALQKAAEAVRLDLSNSEDTIPTLWGALQLYGVA